MERKKWKRWVSPDHDELLMQLMMERRNINTIAESMGFSIPTVSRRVGALGLTRKINVNKTKWLEPEHNELLRKLRGEKTKIRVIAKTLGFSAQTISLRMKVLGLTNKANAGRPCGPDLELVSRNDAIIDDCANGGLSHVGAAIKYNLSPARISQIIKTKPKNGHNG